ATLWLYLRDFLQSAINLGAAWKLALGVIFVLLVMFLRRGLIGGLIDLVQLMRGQQPDETAENSKSDTESYAAPAESPDAATAPRVIKPSSGRPIIEARNISKRYGGLLANSDIDFAVAEGELRGVIGPNGAGKSTFFKMLTCEVQPTGGQILFNGQDITGHNVTKACQLGLTKSYQINQLFTRLTVRENIMISALAKLRGSFRLDLFRSLAGVPGLNERVDQTLRLVRLTERADAPVSALAYGEKRRLEIGLALASDPQLLLLDEPLAGMSPRERMETVKLLKSIREGRTMIVIDHDMDAIFDLAEKITVLSEGKVLIEGTPQEIKNDPVVQEAYLGGVHE
ncbi:MAG: ATP-binding cassette domain-containing protein, partial [Aestuariivirga sp.]